MRNLTLLILGFLFLSVQGLNAQTLAFPSADGFGKYATGGRGGKVIKVTNLNDRGPGSLRAAIDAKGPRIIVFDTAGTIHLKSKLFIDNGDLTIAGQTAPGEGICIAGYPTKIRANNVIIRFMKFRLGDANNVEDDSFGGNDSDTMIIDHCSISWSTDEAASFYRNKNFTLQWCLISHSLNNSVHQKGEHGYGGIWGGMKASFHHNLFANNKSRNPRFSGSASTSNTKDELVDFRNNVIFNWGINSVYGGENGHYNVVNNYYKAGPATSPARKDRILNPSEPYGKFYVDGNIVEGNKIVSENNWNGGVQCDDPAASKHDRPFESGMLKSQPAIDAYRDVVLYAGASKNRDSYDKAVIDNVVKGIAVEGKHKNGLIDSPDEVGGYPVLKVFGKEKDSDNDGIPDIWEIRMGLNPKDASDAIKYTLSKEYTNIELYINELVNELTP